MARLLILSLAALSVLSTGCQQAKMGSNPPKATAQVGPQPMGPGGPVGPGLPPPMPPRFGEPEPRDVINPVVVGPPPSQQPPELPPRAPEPEQWDPRVIPFTPSPPSQPKPPITDVIPSERRGEVPKQPELPPTRIVPTETPAPPVNNPPPTRTASPIAPQTELPPTRTEGPMATPPQSPPPQTPPFASVPASSARPPATGLPVAAMAPQSAGIPTRAEAPMGSFRPQNFNHFKPYRDVPPAQPMAERFVPTPAAEKTVAEKAVETAPTQILTASKPECIGPEGTECAPPKSVEDHCDALPLESKEAKGKLDILIVTDTSLSLRGGTERKDGELTKIARELGYFVGELPDQDIQIAVMAAHGPASPWHGKLFNAGRGDKTVLHIAASSNAQKRANDISEAARILAEKMNKLPNESGGAQGEAMLLSVYDAFTNKSKLGQMIKRDGFLRQDAALNVIFITDEQDVCYDYKKESQKAGHTIEPTKKIVKLAVRDKKRKVIGQKEDRIVDPYEVNFFGKVCARAVKTAGGKSRALDYGDVHRVLSDYSHKRPLIISAIGYKTENIPVGVEDENEMARGIIDLVNLGGNQGTGIMADLAAVNRNDSNASFAPLLKFLGEKASSQIHYSGLWNCTSNMHPDSVNPSSVVVEIQGRNAETIATFSGSKGEVTHHRAQGGAGNRSYSQFRIANDKLLAQALEGKNTEDAVVVIKFSSVTSKDWKTGESLRRTAEDTSPSLEKPAAKPASAKPAAKPTAKAADAKKATTKPKAKPKAKH